jgi:hypothetical protein
MSPAQPPKPWPLTWEIIPVLLGYDVYCVLIEFGNSGAFMLNTDAVPRGPDSTEGSGVYSPFMKASVSLGAASGMEVGDSYGLILEYTSHGYIEIRATQIDDSNAQIEIYSVIESTPTLVDSCTFYNLISSTVDGFVIQGCISKGRLYATVSGQSSSTLVIPAPETPEQDITYPGWRAGFKHYIDRIAYCQFWVISQTVDDDSIQCPGCGICKCEETVDEVLVSIEPIPGVLTAVFVGGGGMDGATATLIAHAECSLMSSWTGCVLDSASCIGPSKNEADQFFLLHLELSCPGPPEVGTTGWQLNLLYKNFNSAAEVAAACDTDAADVEWDVCLTGTCALDGTGAGSLPGLLLLSGEGSTCQPFSLVFHFEDDIYPTWSEDDYLLNGVLCEGGDPCGNCPPGCQTPWTPPDPQPPPSCHVSFDVVVTY